MSIEAKVVTRQTVQGNPGVAAIRYAKPTDLYPSIEAYLEDHPTVQRVNGASPDKNGDLTLDSLASIEPDIYTDGRVPYVETSDALLCAGEWLCQRAGGWFSTDNFADIRSFPALGDKVHASISVNGSVVFDDDLEVINSTGLNRPCVMWPNSDGISIVDFVFLDGDPAKFAPSFSGIASDYITSGDVVRAVVRSCKKTIIHHIHPKFLPYAVLDLTEYDSFGTSNEPLEMDIDDFLRALYYGGQSWFAFNCDGFVARFVCLDWVALGNAIYAFESGNVVFIRNTGTFNPNL